MADLCPGGGKSLLLISDEVIEGFEAHGQTNWARWNFRSSIGDVGLWLCHTEPMSRFQRVTETDEAGTQRLVSLEVVNGTIYRTSKSQMWEGQLPLAALVNLEIAREGSSDLITADTKHGSITWSLKNGRQLIEAIQTQRA
ncbi:MAG: hypothetical protein VX823_10975 [Actinomycetota bacterium]|nr:hypothetical protein [Actinomycetota bacterium]